jgi:MFS family permease
MSTNNPLRRAALHLTFALMLFGFGSISAARVAFSLFALELGASPAKVGLVVATLYIFPLLISWPVGRYADRLGSRRLLLAAAVCGIAAMAIPFEVREVSALYAAGTLLGISFAIYNVLLPNVVGLLSEPQERARNFSNASLVGAMSAFSGPLLAGIAIDLAGHAAACLYLGMLSLIVLALLSVRGRLLPRGSRSAAGASGGMRAALADRDMLRILATSSLVQLGQDLYQFYIPVYGHKIGLSASAIGGVLANYAAAAFVVRFLMPRLVAKLGDERVLAYSFFLAAAGFFLIPFFGNVVALCAISFIFGLGMGCGQPITTMMIFSRSAEGRSGETLGLRQTVNNILRVSGPAGFGLIATAFGLPPVFWLSGLMMAGGALLTHRKTLRDKSDTSDRS